MNVVFCCQFFLFLIFSNAVLIKTPQGRIRGVNRKTLNGRHIVAFLGIPYAKPPIGDLRFKNPVPFGSWKGIKNASADGPECLQYIPSDWSVAHGSEDCLYLNVYTPNVTQPNKYPVLVFIHGGGYALGSSASEYYGPEFLLDKDIILVTINYRLGGLGFASTEDAEMSGNWGLKDQTLALKWIQENIASYGGYTDSITLLGQSAGSGSVHFHLISPLSKGLFHRAIAMSGSAHCPWSIKQPGAIARNTRQLGSVLNCPTNSSKLLVECLRKVTPDRIIQANLNFTLWHEDQTIVYTPVIEQKGTDGAFLTESPITSKSSLPFIIGMTKDEGSMIVSTFQSPTSLKERLIELNGNFPKYGPITLLYDNIGQKTTEIMMKIRKFYFEDKKIDISTIQSVIDMYTDNWIFQCTTSAVRGHEGPGYLYLFTYKGAESKSVTRGNIDYGVSHGADLAYLFPLSSNKTHRSNKTIEDREMINRLVTMWTNFVIYGNPTPNGSEIIWDKVSASNMNYLNINITNMAMFNSLQPERDQFWQKLHTK